MSFGKAQETIQEVKQINQLKSSSEYNKNAKEIEERDLQKHKELYAEMCRIHDEKKQEMIELKKIQTESKQNNERHLLRRVSFFMSVRYRADAA